MGLNLSKKQRFLLMICKAYAQSFYTPYSFPKYTRKFNIIGSLILLLTIIAGCTGNVNLPDSNVDRPYFVMFGGETKNLEDYTYQTDFQVANVHPDTSWEGDLHLRYSVSLATQNPNPKFKQVEAGTGVDSAGTNAITVDIQEMVEQSDQLNSVQEVCGRTVDASAKLNPDVSDNPNHVEEAENLDGGVSLPDSWKQEHSNRFLVKCGDEDQVQGISPIGQTDISDLRVNKEGLDSDSPDRYLNSEEVNIADIENADEEGWRVLFRGLANAPNFNCCTGVWKGKLSAFSSQSFEEVVGDSYLKQLPGELGPKGDLTSLTEQPNGPGFLGARHTNAYELTGVREGNIQNNGLIEINNEGGRVYDAAYQFPDGTPSSEEIVFADRGAEGDSAYLTLLDGSNYTLKERHELNHTEIQGSIISVETYKDEDGETFYLVGSWTRPTIYVYDENVEFEGKVNLGGEVNSTGTTTIEDNTLYVVSFKSWREAPMESYDIQEILNDVTN